MSTAAHHSRRLQIYTADYHNVIFLAALYGQK